MDLAAIIFDVASRADDFLEGAADRAQARAGIAELLNLDYPELGPDLRTEVSRGVMAILETDEFFGIEFVGDPFADETSGEE